MDISIKDLLPFLIDINLIIDERARKQTPLPIVEQYQSEDIKDLIASLIQAQGEFTPVKHNRQASNFGSDFADLQAIMVMAKPILHKNNLCLSFWKELTPGAPILHTKLMHISGQWMESRSKIVPASNDAVSFESKENQLKKNDLKSLLNITIIGDNLDDDGYEDIKKFREMYGVEAVNRALEEPNPNEEVINKEQLELLEKALLGYDSIKQDLLHSFNLKFTADLPQKRFKVVMQKIQERKDEMKKR